MAVFIIDNEEFTVEKKIFSENRLSAVVNGEEITLNVFREGKNFYLEKGGVLIPVFFVSDERNNFYLHIEGETYLVHRKTVEEQAEGGSHGVTSGEIEPPMPGKILKIMVNEGDKVEENQVLLLMESMKLQVEVKAPFDGIVSKLNVKEGQTVNAGEVVVKIEKSV